MLFSILAILGLVALDQVTKYLAVAYLAPVGTLPFIPGVMELRFVLNDGMAFGMFSGGRWVLLAATGLVMAGLLWYLIWKKPEGRLERAALVLILAGGLGNFIDRLLNGYVVDFFATTFIDFAVFNVADCFVCVGVGLMLLAVLLEEHKKKRAAEEPADGST